MNPQESVPALASFDGPVALTKFGWNMFTKHWKTLTPILILPSIIMFVAQLLMLTGNPIVIIICVILFIASVVFSVASMPAMAQAVHKLVVDSTAPVTLKGQYRFGFSVFWSMVLVWIISMLIYMGSLSLFIIPGIVVGIFCSLYIFTFTIDGKRGFAVFTESFSIIRGRWWKVFGRFAFLILLMIIPVLIYAGVAFILGSIFGVPETIIQIILSIVFNIVVGVFAVGYMYRLYASLKQTRTTELPTSTFRGWLIAFLCVGIVSPIVLFVLASSVILASLNVARTKGLEAQNNANSIMAEIQRQIDAENLKSMQSNQTGLPAQK